MTDIKDVKIKIVSENYETNAFSDGTYTIAFTTQDWSLKTIAWSWKTEEDAKKDAYAALKKEEGY